MLDGGDTVAGTLDLNGHGQTVNALSGLSSNVLGRILNDSGSGTNMLTVNNGTGISTTFAGLIQDNTNATSGKVALTLAGTGTLTLSGANSYSGGTTVSNGTLRIGSTTAFGTGTKGTLLMTEPIIQMNMRTSTAKKTAIKSHSAIYNKIKAIRQL